MLPLNSLGQDDHNKLPHDNFAMQCNWHQHHMMSVASQMVPLNSVGQDDCNEVQHDFLHHMMPSALASASHDANCIVNDTTELLRSR